MSHRQTYSLVIRDTGSPPDVPGIVRLRRLLKSMLRTFGYRCTSIGPSTDSNRLEPQPSHNPPPTGCQCDRRDNDQLEPLSSHNPPLANAGCVVASLTHELAATVSTEGSDNERGKLTLAGHGSSQASKSSSGSTRYPSP